MNRILYLLIIIALTACQQFDLPKQQGGGCVLELDVERAHRPSVASRGADSDLALTIFDAAGELYLFYSPGTIPNKIILEPGKFTVCAHTDNLDTWHTACDGRGEACYFASQSVEMEYDQRTRLSLSVPMINYAVEVALPDLFDKLFDTYQFVLESGEREVIIREGEKAYFSVADGGFTYSLSVTNTDGVSHAHSPIWFFDIQGGKHYLLRYHYESGATSGSVDIEITDDMDIEDDVIDL